MLITRHASRLILGKPFVLFNPAGAYDSYWTCGCRANTVEPGTLELEWCQEHAPIFDDADLKLQA